MGRRPRGGPKRRFIDAVKEDMKLVDVKEDDGLNGGSGSTKANLKGNKDSKREK